MASQGHGQSTRTKGTFWVAVRVRVYACALGQRVPIVLDAVRVVVVCELVVVRQHVRQVGAAVLALAVERLVEDQLARVVVLLARDARDRVGHALVVDLLLVVDDVVVAHLRVARAVRVSGCRACDGATNQSVQRGLRAPKWRGLLATKRAPRTRGSQSTRWRRSRPLAWRWCR